LKTPASPPTVPAPENFGESLVRALSRGFAPWLASAQQDYRAWETFRFTTPPEGFAIEEWWHVVRAARMSSARRIPGLVDKKGTPFSFNLPDEVLATCDTIAREASGQIRVSELVTNPETRDRYVVNSLIEEAITSSQLEGAVTSRRDAKDMIRSGRAPRDHSERMILNNYIAMQRIRELSTKPLTPDTVRELHRIVTDGTLENPEYAGRLQDDDALRVSVWGDDDQLLHRPPPVAELAHRLDALCEFANGTSESPYMPPVLRAVTIHFMLGYDHYFEDGNGRTARALFYWSMLREGYWLTEYLSISRILRKAHAKYARSFLLTESDNGDLTHFFIYQLDVIRRALAELHEYLAAKSSEIREVQSRLKGMPREFNHRQLALLEHAIRNPDAVYTAKSHGGSHRVTIETGRQDLVTLEQRGLLSRFKISKQFAWKPANNLKDLL
jgi:Fic family protein